MTHCCPEGERLRTAAHAAAYRAHIAAEAYHAHRATHGGEA